MAVTDTSKKRHGISRVHRGEGNAGFRPGKKKTSWACAPATLSEADFHRLPQFPRKICWAREGEGFINSLQMLDGGRISIASLGLGMAQGAYEAAVIRQAAQAVRPSHRRVSGHPVQAGGHGHARSKRRACSSIRAAWLADGWHRKHVRFTRESSMAKLFAGEVAVRVANEAVQIHGGYGFIKDYPVEKFYRDVKLCTIGEGTSEIQRLVIARQLLGKK